MLRIALLWNVTQAVWYQRS